MTLFASVTESIKTLKPAHRRSAFFLCAAFFLVLFAYSSIRSVVTAIYLNNYGAKATPLASFVAVFALVATLSVSNFLQKWLSIQRLFAVISIVSTLLFLGSYWGILNGLKPLAHLLFIWKELYIVILVHLLWGYAVNFFSEISAKVYFGFVAAGGSLGGMLGGMFVSKLSAVGGVSGVVYSMSVLLLLTAIIFLGCEQVDQKKQTTSPKKKSPITALKGIERYVLFVGALVILSQFCISIIDFQFNVKLEQLIPDVSKKTEMMGVIFAYANGISLLIKVLVLPFLFSIFSNRQVQVMVPVSYLLTVVLGLGQPAFFVAAFSFGLVKCFDYSVFSVSKEFFYYGLSADQKYGMKYVADMFGYRFGKAVISGLLIFVQSSAILSPLLIVLLLGWIVLISRPPKAKTRMAQ